MTEVARDHLKDIQEQKRIANQAFKKKTHNGRGGCALSTDTMTNAQIKAKNGSMVVYKTGVPISFEEFRSYPKDIQQKYINEMQSRFGISTNALGNDMFKINSGLMYAHVKKTGLTYKKIKHYHTPEFDNDRKVWREWLASYKPAEEAPVILKTATIARPEDEPTPVIVPINIHDTASNPDPEPTPTPEAPVPQSFVLSLKGSADEPVTVEYLATVLRAIYGDKIPATVDVRVYKKGGEV